MFIWISTGYGIDLYALMLSTTDTTYVWRANGNRNIFLNTGHIFMVWIEAVEALNKNTNWVALTKRYTDEKIGRESSWNTN